MFRMAPLELTLFALTCVAVGALHVGVGSGGGGGLEPSSLENR